MYMDGSDSEEQGIRIGQEALQEALNPYHEDHAEIILGIVSPLGTNIEPIIEAIKRFFDCVGYSCNIVRLSELLDEVNPQQNLPGQSEKGYIYERMNAGDKLRERFHSGSALAALGINRIWDHRLSLHPESGSDPNIGARPIQCHATVLRTLKHPDEVRLLRATYRARFLCVGVSASEPDRRRNVQESLRVEMNVFSGTDVAGEAEQLLARDSADPGNRFGQNVRATFDLADVYIDATEGRGAPAAITRFLRLVFGDQFETPTQEELAMAHAQTAGLRSSAAGRQVGATIYDAQRSLVAAGCNEVPKYFGGQYWPGDAPDDRDFYQDVDPNDQLSRRVLGQVLTLLKEDGWLNEEHSSRSSSDLVDHALLGAPAEADGRSPAPLGDARVNDLIEFGRIMHAEMAALIDCSSRGAAVRGGTLYTTTFPCHECARHIIGAGIIRVVYISPYPKSLVRELFEKSAAIDAGTQVGDRVEFSPFVGVAPRLFRKLFTGASRKDKATGRILRWDPKQAALKTGGEVPAVFVLDRETEVLTAVKQVRPAALNAWVPTS